MTIFDLFNVLGGLAFFLFGMTVMSGGLKKAAGGRMEEMLQKMTDNLAKSLAFGAIITIAIQSSSALTVMLVGLVNSGIMNLSQTVGIIMGSNVGTTLTAWILSTSGIQTDNIFLSMLKPEHFSPIIALVGVVMMMAAKEERRKDIGSILIGFAVLMKGMQIMSDTLKPLADMPEFAHILTAFRNPILGVIVGAVFTGVIQSSAASVGVLQALSLTGQISYAMAIPIIMGQNIGTCVTALLSAIGVSKNAKRVSVIHVSFNLIGTAVGLVVYLICESIIRMPALEEPITPFAVAGFHSVFNIMTTIILLPFGKQLVYIARKVVKEDTVAEVFLDDRLLMTPTLAVEECRKKTVLVMNEAFGGLKIALDMFEQYDEEKDGQVQEMEATVDDLVEKCNQFLIKLSSNNITDINAVYVADMLQSLGDMERISDYSLSLAGATKKMKKKPPKYYRKECRVLNTEITDLLIDIEECYIKKDGNKASDVIERANDLVGRIKLLRKKDIKGLKNGESDAQLSVYMTEYLTGCRRVVEHGINIAGYLADSF
ncbi:MAG: Na/Pi cotransporter family protein [Lachnospiraceae bacterium]|nr:Na/Pi cotransporter family protein [Lachnospiraceae bacterium]